MEGKERTVTMHACRCHPQAHCLYAKLKSIKNSSLSKTLSGTHTHQNLELPMYIPKEVSIQIGEWETLVHNCAFVQQTPTLLRYY